MESFIKEHFLLHKYLLSMEVGKTCSLTTSRCPYNTIKSVCYQLKKQGKGVWKVTKKHCISSTSITREQ